MNDRNTDDAVRALRESEEKYRSLFESMDEVFYFVEIVRDAAGAPVDILYIDENRAAVRLLGQAVKGQRLSDVDPHFDHFWLGALDKVSRTGNPDRFERLSVVTGRWHDYHLFRAPSGKDHVGLLANDITDRKLATDALRKSEEELRVALEAGRMGTYRLNLKTGEQRWSDRQYDIFGLRKGVDVPSRELFLSLVEPDDHHRIEFSLDDIRTPGTYLDSEFRITRPDGERRWITAHALALFDAEGHPAELIGVNLDVTEQRKLEAAMHSSEERLREFSEAMSDVMWIRRARDLQWEFLSPAFHKIYGISRQDALRGDNYQSWLDLIVEEDRESALANIEAVRGGERRTFEYRIRRPEDGQIRWLRNTDFPMRDEDGAVIRIGGVGHDITLLKQAEEHQKLLTAELQHRVRNTLAVIRSMARRTARSSETVEDFAMSLEGRIDAFARVQAVVTRDPSAGVDLAMLVVEELRAASAREGETLMVEGPDLRLKPKPAETFALGLHELVTNAIKYGALQQDGGRVDVRWTHTDGRIEFVWKESGVAPNGAPARNGLGTEILTRTLPYELTAVARLEIERDGARYELTMPDTVLTQNT